MKFLLVIWLGSPTNFVVHEQLETQKQCTEKKELLSRALAAAKSELIAECREDQA
jgi:hypothetical protein